MIRRYVATHVNNESTLLFYVIIGYYLAFHVSVTLFHVNRVLNLCEETCITYIISCPRDVALGYYGHYFIIGTTCAIAPNNMLIFYLK
jgi:hypothetical protein